MAVKTPAELLQDVSTYITNKIGKIRRSEHGAVTRDIIESFDSLITTEKNERINNDSFLDSLLQAKQDNLGFIPENIANKGNANGYCGLDAGNKVPIAHLPSTLLVYKGVWNALTNTPILANNDISKAGHVFNVGTAGNNFGIDWKLGDWLIFNDYGIIEKSDNSDDVVSVNGKQGVVILGISDIPLLQGLLDAKVVGAASATDNAIARFDGTTGKLVQNSGVFVDDNGQLGISKQSPTAKLHVLTDALGTLANDYKIISKLDTGGDNTYSINESFVRNADGSDWLTARNRNFISIDNSYITPSTGRVWYDRFPYTGTHSWGGGASTFATLNANGLGIGIAPSAGTKLLIEDTTANTTINVRTRSPYQQSTLILDGYRAGANGNVGAIVMSNNQDSLAAIVTERTGADDGGSLYFGTQATSAGGVVERMRILPSGNVGIGFTDPTSILEVNTTSTNVQLTGIASSGGLNLTRINGTRTAPTAIVNANTVGALSFTGQYGTTVGQLTIGAQIQAIATGNWSSTTAKPTDLVFYTAPSSGALAERMRILSSGEVSIGTTSNIGTFGVSTVGTTIAALSSSSTGSGPVSQLRFLNQSSVAAANNKNFVIANNNTSSAGGANTFQIQARNDDNSSKLMMASFRADTGGLGLGIDAADTRLHTYGSEAEQFRVERTTNSNTVMSFKNTLGSTWIGRPGNSDILGISKIGADISTITNDVVYINSSGYVGIGVTATPTVPLEVNGDIKGGGITSTYGTYMGIAYNQTIALATATDLISAGEVGGKTNKIRNYLTNTSGVSGYMSFEVNSSTGRAEILKLERNNSTGDTVTITGNLAISGNVDGRDVSADGLKLDSAIEISTGVVIKDFAKTLNISSTSNSVTLFTVPSSKIAFMGYDDPSIIIHFQGSIGSNGSVLRLTYQGHAGGTITQDITLDTVASSPYYNKLTIAAIPKIMGTGAVTVSVVTAASGIVIIKGQVTW